MSELLEIITELFETNVQQYDNRNITPLNAAKYEQKIEKPRDANIKKEIYTSLKQVLVELEELNGITRKTYEKNLFAINSAARRFADLNQSSVLNGKSFCYAALQLS